MLSEYRAPELVRHGERRLGGERPLAEQPFDLGQPVDDGISVHVLLPGGVDEVPAGVQVAQGCAAQAVESRVVRAELPGFLGTNQRARSASEDSRATVAMSASPVIPARCRYIATRWASHAAR